jgi:hypothetical protein
MGQLLTADLDRSSRINSPTLSMLSFAAENGNDFNHGGVAIFCFEFKTEESMQQPRFSLLFYDHERKLISAVGSKTTLVPIQSVDAGHHKANFHLMMSLNAGEYSVGVQIEALETSKYTLLSRNELLLGFSVAGQDDTPVDLTPAPILAILSVDAVTRPIVKALREQELKLVKGSSEIGENVDRLKALIASTSKKMLGMGLTEVELHRFVSETKNQGPDFDRFMDAMLSDPRAWSESVKNNAGKLVTSVYNSLLDREPEFETLNLKKSIDVTKFLKSIRSSTEFENLATSKARMKRFEFLGRSEEEDRKLKIGGNCVFVHTPLGGIFLYCALACCQQLKREYHDKEVYLISDVALEDSINPLDFDSLGIHGFFRTSQILSTETTSTLNPGLIVSHSEGLMENTIGLTSKYSDALFGVWSDGLRNGTNTNRWLPNTKVEKIYFFGYKGYVVGNNFAIEKIIPPSFLWDAQKTLLDRQWAEAPSLVRPKYSVFYPRYWWRAPYNFKKEFILNSWLETILENSDPDELIVIKSSPLYGDDIGVIAELREQLLANGRAAVYCSDFCISIGLDEAIGKLSSEDLFYLGILENATTHYVLDGSLASIIASHPSIRRPSKVILGSKIDLNNNVGLSVLVNNLAGQMQGLMEFSKFSLVNAEKFKDGYLPAIVSLD